MSDAIFHHIDLTRTLSIQTSQSEKNDILNYYITKAIASGISKIRRHLAALGTLVDVLVQSAQFPEARIVDVS
jgi:hypothetical protein